MGALGVIFGSWDRLLRVLGQTFASNLQEKLDFAILTPLCSKTSTFGGLAGQVGATWSRKSHPRDARGGQSGGQGGKKGAGSGQSGRPVCRSYGNGRNSAENQIRAEVKVYLTGEPYD